MAKWQHKKLTKVNFVKHRWRAPLPLRAPTKTSQSILPLVSGFQPPIMPVRTLSSTIDSAPRVILIERGIDFRHYKKGATRGRKRSRKRSQGRSIDQLQRQSSKVRDLPPSSCSFSRVLVTLSTVFEWKSWYIFFFFSCLRWGLDILSICVIFSSFCMLMSSIDRVLPALLLIVIHFHESHFLGFGLGFPNFRFLESFESWQIPLDPLFFLHVSD